MLILSRNESQCIFIGDNIKITILRSHGPVDIGIDAPKEIPILRENTIKRSPYRKIQRSKNAEKYWCNNFYKRIFRMTEEFKLRAWTGSVMEYFDLFHVPAYYLQSGNLWNNGITRFQIMRFTGIKDTDNKEVFEGDILGDIVENSVYGKSIVKFGEFNISLPSGIHCFIGFYREYFYDFGHGNKKYNIALSKFNSKVKIIGNIWENPELLE